MKLNGAVIPDEMRGQPGAPEARVLVIITELASKNLLQRLHECQKEGLPGIPPGEQAHIFSPYVRGRAGRQARCTGLGLGLHIVQTLVRLHGGTVGVRSTPGEGACFWFRLPALGLGPAPRQLACGPISRS